ncbi:hypothetical protein AALO_G00185300 [Alosa alosa]|uniref:RRM domain-containing protein n=1 Tax=Alosa alosa TaxID=278164 RepID=A0AAV6G9T9_9TELE|nr:RNA binding motif protein 12Ba [Alosa alosa]XP_048117019.1 RNA binding motif protein 12Ba [Alosa alosa]KAG5271893.1 hypothetical protein AALO_G00185300 [Alosa alosa]
MAIVLRLQGLTFEAEADDIREFFHGLWIPQGAVHITGGDLGEAFIIFSSEQDGQLAMRRSGNVLKGSHVTLHISSPAELKEKLVLSLKQDSTKLKDSPETQSVDSTKQSCEKVEPLSNSQPDAATLLLALCIALNNGMETKTQTTSTKEDPNSSKPLINSQTTQTSHSPSPTALSPSLSTTDSDKVEKEQLKMEASVCNPGYLRLYGLPHIITKAEIRHFLHGLCVQQVLVNVRLGERRGCLVKVASEDEVEVGLQRNGKTFRTFPVEIKKATVKQWTYATMKPKGSPQQIQTVTLSPEVHLDQKEACISTCKRPHSGDQFPKTFKKKREEYYIMVRNLQPSMNKTAIKTLLGCSHLPNSKVQHLLDKNLMRTSTAFVAFDLVEDYVSAMNLSGSRFGTLVLDVSSITREKMMSQLCSNRKIMDKPKWPHSGLSKTCVYVRNLPADVSLVQVQDIFQQFLVAKEDVTLLRDNKGNGLGEAVVLFGTEATARETLSLHRGSFLGNEILLTLITPQQRGSMLSGQSLND